MNIRVDFPTPIKDGTEVVFRSPVDCSQVTGLLICYPENGVTASKEFAFADAHGNNVGDIDHLFAENVVVKVILDVTTSMAFVQNADTNAYLESRFTDLQKQILHSDRTIEDIDHRTELLQSKSVLTTEQTLTPEQQAYARANINAMEHTAEIDPLIIEVVEDDDGNFVIQSEIEWADIVDAIMEKHPLELVIKGQYPEFPNVKHISTYHTNIEGGYVVFTYMDGRYAREWYVFRNGTVELLTHEKEDVSNKVTVINMQSDDEQYPTAKAVYDLVQNSGGSTQGDFPTFEKNGGNGATEYNEIAKAVEVSTVEELLSFDGNAILSGYRYYKSVVEHTSYSLLKIPVRAGDLIRDKLCTFWRNADDTSAWLWVTFFNESGTSVGDMRVVYDGNTNTSFTTNYLDIRENGITVPDGSSYALVNVYAHYMYTESTAAANNGISANIITVNQNADLTYYDGVSPLADYIPQTGTGEVYYEAVDDVRIPRYEDALGDIETALDSIIAAQESLIGGVTE